jgi:hypothetical protein
MTTIYGAIGIQDRNATVDSVGQRVVFDTINQFAARQEAELDSAARLFVQEETDLYSEQYYLPGSGMLQAAANLSRPGAVKSIGTWSTGYPIEDGRDQVAVDDIAAAYMNGPQLEAHVRGVFNRYTNWRRFLMLRSLLNKDNESVTDPIHGAITVKRLANGDADEFPPIIGSATQGTENHYLGTNYAAADISDTNNPLKTLSTELSEHFGDGMKVAFINAANQDKISALTAFYDRVPQYVQLGANGDTATAAGLAVPGTFIGAANDVAVFVWNWIPSGYILGVDATQPAPLKKRVDSVASLRGFGLVATQQEYPLTGSFWRAREGYGVANRLNGVALQLVASTSYTTPTAYA